MGKVQQCKNGIESFENKLEHFVKKVTDKLNVLEGFN